MGGYRDEMELALMMAGEAGKIILPHFREAASLRVETKADNSPVTIADQSAEAALRKLMEKHTPGYGVIGEEFGSVAGSTDREWVVDPIDGTKAFIHGVPLFGTLLALLEKGRPVVGVIALPALGQVLYATEGGGCFLDGKPCRVSPVGRIEDSLLLDGSATTMERLGHGPAWAALRARAKLHRGWGDCYGHMLVACGRAEAMFDPIVSIWDVAPMAVILPEAGGRFSALSGRGSITENSGISSNGLIHEDILRGLGQALSN